MKRETLIRMRDCGDAVGAISIIVFVLSSSIFLCHYWYHWEWSLGPTIDEWRVANIIIHALVVVMHIALFTLYCVFVTAFPITNMVRLTYRPGWNEDMDERDYATYGKSALKCCLGHALFSLLCLGFAFILSPVFFLSAMLVFQIAAIAYLWQWRVSKHIIAHYCIPKQATNNTH